MGNDIGIGIRIHVVGQTATFQKWQSERWRRNRIALQRGGGKRRWWNHGELWNWGRWKFEGDGGGWASTALAHQQYPPTIFYSISYAMIQFLGSTFKEGQSLMYLKVAQAAFVQLAETVFVHLHTLSLDWHLQKKIGGVIRSMDRGIAAWCVVSLV